MGRWPYCKGLLLAGILSQSGCFLPYVIKQGLYQAELMCGARPVEKVVLDPKTSPNDRDKLQLIAALKRFSVSHLKMRESANYTIINPSWHRSLNVVSACKELAFEPYIWKFPIIGKVPYLGHFDESDAIAAEASLKAKGYDTMLVRVAAYSTLGYFNDPIWPQMLKRSIHSLAEVILHELAHLTLYFGGQSDFNESFANFVGRKGALLFLERNYGKNSPEYKEAVLYHRDDRRLSDWQADLRDQLEKVYNMPISADDKRKQKSQIIKQSETSFQHLGFESQAFKGFETPVVNNATLIMAKRYNSNQEDFEKLLTKVDGNWSEFYKHLKTIQGHTDPFSGLKLLVK